MKKLSSIGILIILLFGGCSSDNSKDKKLVCYVNKVVDAKAGKTTMVSHQDAIKNNFVYRLVIDDEGLLTVNGSEQYQEIPSFENNDTVRIFAVKHGVRLNSKVQFQLSRSFDNVEFLLTDDKIKYGFECIQN